MNTDFLATQTTRFLNAQFLLAKDYTNKQIFFAIGVMIASFIIIKIMNYLMKGKLREMAEKTDTPYDEKILEAIASPVNIFIYLAGFHIAVAILNPEHYRYLFFHGIQICMVIDIVWLLYRLTDLVTEYFHEKFQDQRQMTKTLYPLINKTLKVFIGLVAFILIVQNMGYSVSSLLAGLGIGGLAVALAAKDTLSNIFGSITIFLDKSLFIGDWVKVNGAEGIVEDVGFRTTKIRTFAKSLVVIPNSVIANNNIENISRRGMQKLVMNIGVTYDTTADKMEETLEVLRRIIREHPKTNKESFYVYFSEFKDSSLNIFMYFFIESTVWRDFLQAREEINLQIMRELQELKVDFAFPTQSIYLENLQKTQHVNEILTKN